MDLDSVKASGFKSSLSIQQELRAAVARHTLLQREDNLFVILQFGDVTAPSIGHHMVRWPFLLKRLRLKRRGSLNNSEGLGINQDRTSSAIFNRSHVCGYLWDMLSIRLVDLDICFIDRQYLYIVSSFIDFEGVLLLIRALVGKS